MSYSALAVIAVVGVLVVDLAVLRTRSTSSSGAVTTRHPARRPR